MKRKHVYGGLVVLAVGTFWFVARQAPDSGTTSGQQRAAAAPEGERIPRSMSESANYYLISIESDGNYFRTTHSRVSSQSRGYSVSRIDCSGRRYQDLGYGDGSQSNIRMYDDVQWVEVMNGSSKSDLVAFVCQNKAG